MNRYEEEARRRRSNPTLAIRLSSSTSARPSSSASIASRMLRSSRLISAS